MRSVRSVFTGRCIVTFFGLVWFGLVCTVPEGGTGGSGGMGCKGMGCKRLGWEVKGCNVI